MLMQGSCTGGAVTKRPERDDDPIESAIARHEIGAIEQYGHLRLRGNRRDLGDEGRRLSIRSPAPDCKSIVNRCKRIRELDVPRFIGQSWAALP